MENNLFNISGDYIGKVISVNRNNREIEVFVPKLIPTLNYGFSDMTYSIGLQTEVLKKNTILCKPFDFKMKLPKKDSLVRVYFLGGDIKKIYWRDFDPFGTNEYYDDVRTKEETFVDNLMNSLDVKNNIIFINNNKVEFGTKQQPLKEIHGFISINYVKDLREKLKDYDKNISELNKINKVLLEKLEELIEIKEDIKDALETKGLDLDGVPFKEYAELIENL